MPYIFAEPNLSGMTKKYSVSEYISLSLKFLVSSGFFYRQSFVDLNAFFPLSFDSKDNAECGATWRSSSFCKFQLTSLEISGNGEYQVFISISRF